MGKWLGTKINFLTILDDSPGPNFLCQCDCGTIKEIRKDNVQSGNTKSCGCWGRKRGYGYPSHGMTDSKEWRAWLGMRYRCNYKKHKSYAYYGGRGIRVCDEWQESFEAFYAHIGPAPSPQHTVDRIDVDGNYAPGNVRWATRKEQIKNRRKR